MADSIYTFDPTAANNTSLDTIPYGPNQLYHNQIDNLFRAYAAKLAQYVDDIGGVNTAGGSANAHTVTLASGITAYASGLRFMFTPTATNTTNAVTLNVNSIGAISVKKLDSTGTARDLDIGDIRVNRRAEVVYGAALNIFVLLNPANDTRYPPNYMYSTQAYTIQNNTGDANNDLDIPIMGCRDSTDAANIDLLSALVKKLDASWTVGTNQGMLDGSESSAGTPDTSTWYHIFLIKRPDTGVVDVLASESATAPTMPTNYTLKRRIGSVYNDSSGNIKAFSQNGREFLWLTQVSDFVANNYGDSAVTRTVSVPTGVKVTAIVDINFSNNSSSAASEEHVTALDQTDAATSTTNCTFRLLASGAWAEVNGGRVYVRTNTSGQFRSRGHTIGANTFFQANTQGWIDNAIL